jgi:BON domain
MQVISGPVRYFYLHKARGPEEIEGWPPAIKPLQGPNNQVCTVVRLYASNTGWRAECGDEPAQPNGATEPAMILTRNTALGLLQDGKRGRAEVELLGVRVVNADGKGVEYVTHFVVAAAPGSRLGSRRPRVVPIESLVVGDYVEGPSAAVAELDLRMAPGEYGNQPVFLPDEQIKRLAEDTLDRFVFSTNAFTYGQHPHRDITVEVEAGRVSLHGKTDLDTIGEQAEAALLATPGVVEVADHVLYLEDLKFQVEQALAAKGLDDLTVLVEHALVNLHGEVPDSQTRYQAEDIAKRIPGVRGVVNDIVVAEPTTAAG